MLFVWYYISNGLKKGKEKELNGNIRRATNQKTDKCLTHCLKSLTNIKLFLKYELFVLDKEYQVYGIFATNWKHKFKKMLKY